MPRDSPKKIVPENVPPSPPKKRHSLGLMSLGVSNAGKQKKLDDAKGNSMKAAHAAGKSDREKVYDPQESFMKGWDSTISLALAFTAFVTPFEIGYLSTQLDVLFCVNRMIDIVFCCDIYINLKLAYFDQRRSNWVYNPRDCALHYMKGWFTIDVVSLIPWDVIAFVAEQNASSGGGGSGDMESLKILRLLKILKITKLVRMVKAIRIFKRIATQLKMSHTQLMLLKYCMIMVIATHWLACAWGLLPTMMSSNEVVAIVNSTDAGGDGDGGSTAEITWIQRIEADQKSKMTVTDAYSYSLEYSLSVMCMGFGTVEPGNSSERWFSIFSLLFAGMLYAYVVGGICAAIANEDPAVTAYNENMDMLMIFLDKHDIPVDLRIEAFDYFTYSRQLLEDQCHLRVLDFMAPSIRSKICGELYGEWLMKVPFFNPPQRPREQREFHMNISLLLEPVAFPPNEILYMVGDDSTSMFIVQRGLLKSVYMHAYASFRILTVGEVFGAESIEACSPRRATVRSLSFVSLARLSTEDLFSMLARKPKALAASRRLIAQAAARSSLTAHMRKLGRAMLELRVSMGARRRTPEEFLAIKEVTLTKIDRVRQQRKKEADLEKAMLHAKAKFASQKFKKEDDDTAASALTGFSTPGATEGSLLDKNGQIKEELLVAEEEGASLFESMDGDIKPKLKVSQKMQQEIRIQTHLREVQSTLEEMTASFGDSYFQITNPHDFLTDNNKEGYEIGGPEIPGSSEGVTKKMPESPTNGTFVGELCGEWRHVSHLEKEAKPDDDRRLQTDAEYAQFKGMIVPKKKREGGVDGEALLEEEEEKVAEEEKGNTHCPISGPPSTGQQGLLGTALIEPNNLQGLHNFIPAIPDADSAESLQRQLKMALQGALQGVIRGAVTEAVHEAMHEMHAAPQHGRGHMESTGATHTASRRAPFRR
jgi:CRP-like cAMP-binding protein